jgi:foldase protein PrsA
MTTRTRILPTTLALLASAAALVAAGCGKAGEDVPADAIAVVSGTPVPRAELDQLIAQLKKSYAKDKTAFPKVGTEEYQGLQSTYVSLLVERVALEQEGEKLGLEVSDADVQAQLDQLLATYFGGSKAKYEAQLKTQGLTEAAVREDLRSRALYTKIFDKITADTEVTDEDVRAYYDEQKADYVQGESREVRHILVKDKALADDLYAQVKAGANFAALAKKYSTDKGSAKDGGKLPPIRRGETVGPFDQTAFLLRTGQISRPIKTEFGYHIVMPISDIKPAKTTPFAQVSETIRSTLLQQRKEEKMTDWVADLKRRYESKTTYAVGFEPPAVPDTPAG